jgi:diguanylate cyclase (GGDEF)-like protein/PAS domain S-box-containing protein
MDVLLAVAIANVGLYLSWFALRWGGRDFQAAIADAAFVPIGLAAIGLAVGARSSVASPGSRRAWRFFILAMAFSYASDVASLVRDVALRTEATWPSILDAGYLAAYPLLVAGVVALTRTRAQNPLRAALDITIVAVGTGTATWVLLLGPAASAYADDPLRLVVALAYPVFEAAAIFALVAALMSRLTDMSRAAVAFLAAGVSLNLAADLVSGRGALDQNLAIGGPEDLAYMAAWLALGLAGYAQWRTDRSSKAVGEPTAPPRLLALLPYVAVAVVYVLLVVSSPESGPDFRPVVLAAGAVTCLVVARQVVMARENATLLAERASVRLEARFRALIQNASDVIAVTDEQGTITYVTPSSARLLNRDAESLVGMALPSLLADEDAQVAVSLIQAAAGRPGSTGPVEWRLPPAPSGARYVDVTATNLLDDPTIRGLVITIRDITDRKLFEQQLEHQAFHDPLTGLANRALLANRVEHALSRAQRRPAKPAVIYLDLDDFKRVNDSQGHDAGDRVLLEVSRRLRLALREEDTAARLGGDEFAILVDETSSVHEATAIAERIHEALTRPIELDEGALSISGSMGVVRADGHEMGAIELLRNADIAMYEAKREARGGHRIFEPAMFSATVERVRLEEDLRLALDHGELALVYQPLVSLADRTTVGFEALLRWNHPQRGLVMPLSFIPIAEHSGEIIRIGRWVVEEACGTIGAWNRGLNVPLRANVNVSVRQLSPSFVDEVREILGRTGFPPQLLVIELTESVLAANRAAVVGVLGRLRDLGVRIAIDDFGTGYSSLSYLHDLPIDEIKIDRSFVESLTRRGDTRLISTIIGLGRKLGLTMIAEGIELEEQADRLLALGCEFGQGYLIGRPASAEVSEERIRTGATPRAGEPARRGGRSRA